MGESKLRKRLGLGPTTAWKRAEPKTRVAADYSGIQDALEKDPEFALHRRFTAGYTGSFYAKHGTDAPLDLALCWTPSPTSLSTQPAAEP
jgi:hypothetical protein